MAFRLLYHWWKSRADIAQAVEELLTTDFVFEMELADEPRTLGGMGWLVAHGKAGHADRHNLPYFWPKDSEWLESYARRHPRQSNKPFRRYRPYGEVV